MRLKAWEIALICAFLSVFVCGFSLRREEAALSDKLVRLHVVANSDSEADQALKLRVRDAVLEYLRPRLEGVEDAAEARRVIAEIRPENRRSRRVAERLGMQVTGEFVKRYHGKDMLHLIYSRERTV